MSRLATAAVLVVMVWPVSGCGTEEGSAADQPVRAESTGSRLTVRPLDDPVVQDVPDELDDLNRRLSGLVDFHDTDFSGAWYDETTDELVIGVATGHGEQVLRHKGLADEPRLREERVRWSLLEGQTILARFQARSQVGDRFVMWGTRPQGDGFRIEMTGDDLSQAERDELLTLPGRIDVATGTGAGGELS